MNASDLTALFDHHVPQTVYHNGLTARIDWGCTAYTITVTGNGREPLAVRVPCDDAKAVLELLLDVQSALSREERIERLANLIREEAHELDQETLLYLERILDTWRQNRLAYRQTMMRRGQHVVSFHDGNACHTDGSPFYRAAIFKNAKDADRFARNLAAKGYAKC